MLGDFMETREKDEETLIFRYNRKERLKNAPKNVQDFYSGNFSTVPRGLFRSLFANKTSKIMFLTIIFLLMLSMFLTFLSPKENTVSVENLKIQLNAIYFEDKIYCSLEFPSSNDFLNREEFVYAKFLAFDENDNLINSDFDSGIYSGEKKYFRCAFMDFEIAKITCELDFCENIYILKEDVK